MILVFAQNRRFLMALAVVVGFMLLLYVGPKLVEADETDFDPLELSGVCTDDSTNQRHWLISNPNVQRAFDDVVWDIVDTNPPVTGTVGIVPVAEVSDSGEIIPSKTPFTTPIQSAASDIIKITYALGVTFTTATSNPEPCIPQEADLSINKEGPEEVINGDTFTYTITATNNGPQIAPGVVVTDTLPPGLDLISITTSSEQGSCDPANAICQFEEIGAGASAIVELVVMAGKAETLTNTAEVSSQLPDPDSSNNQASVTSRVIPQADLSVKKEGPREVFLGEIFAYELTVTNRGPDDGPNVMVTDALPAGLKLISSSPTQGSCDNPGPTVPVTVTCELGELNATLSATVEIKVEAVIDGEWKNEAKVSSDYLFDPVENNNTASAHTNIIPPVGVCFEYKIFQAKDGSYHVVPHWNGSLFVGSNGRDKFNGTQDDDLILGLGGDDRLRGGQGNDVICGGTGDDDIWGNQGDDILIGGTTTAADDKSGRDDIRGDGGKDIIYAGDGEDRANGHHGEDEIHGGTGNDRLDGSNDDDTLFGDEGPDDYLIGGNGDDEGHDPDGARVKSVETFNGEETTNNSKKSKK